MRRSPLGYVYDFAVDLPTVLTFTLDTNCIIAVDENRSEAKAVLELASAHRSGLASVGVVAISASERQRDGVDLENFEEFKQRRSRLGLGELDLLEPMSYFDITFWDFGLLCDDTMEALEREIHQILFPNFPFLWGDYCEKLGLIPATTKPDKKWRNAKCDVQAFWSHSFRKRDVFVTSGRRDSHAKTKKQRLVSLAGSRIETPESAAKLLRHAPCK